MAVSSKPLYRRIASGLEPELIRGTSPSYILRRCAAVLADSKGSDLTFLASKPVEILDFFISHSWKTNQYLKFGALCYTWNVRGVVLGIAFIIGAALACVVCLRLSGHMGPLDYLIARCFFLDGIIVLLCVAVCTAQCCSCAEQRVFIDKVCIHQTDDNLKKKGILKLGAILARSQTLLILYDDHYFSRLWCSYELAVYARLHEGDEGIVVVPVVLPFYISLGIILNALGYHICFDILWNTNASGFSLYIWMMDTFGNYKGTGLFWTVGYIPSIMAMTVFMKHKLRQNQSMRRRIDEFDLLNLDCSDKQDRQYVLNHIDVLWGDKRMNTGANDDSDDDDDDDEERLKAGEHPNFRRDPVAHTRGTIAFETFVRNEFPKLMASHSLDDCCNWQTSLLIFMPGVLGGCIDMTTASEEMIVDMVGVNDYRMYLWSSVCFYTAQSLFFYPVVLVWMMRLTRATDGCLGGSFIVFMFSLVVWFLGQSSLTWLTTLSPCWCPVAPVVLGTICAFEYGLFSMSRQEVVRLWNPWR